LIPRLGAQLRIWVREPDESANASACMRILHTLKGGARLAGAMRLGEMAHRLETRIERILAHPPVAVDDLEALEGRCDNLAHALEALAGREQAAAPSDVEESPVAPPAVVTREPTLLVSPSSSSPAAPGAVPTPHAEQAPPKRFAEPAAPVGADAESAATSVAGVSESTDVDWSRFFKTEPVRAKAPDRGAAASQAAVRVGAPLLDRLVNLAGEVSITRSRVEVGVGQIKTSLGDLTENLERLRGQLRDIEIQGETQMTSRLEAGQGRRRELRSRSSSIASRAFQELTRMMAESVNDVATVQRTLQRSLETTEDELVAQSRMTRDLQDDLLRTRMVEFEGLSIASTASCGRPRRKPASRCGSTSSAARSKSTAACSTG
jgi:chemosensory pili system protein ChpA (sensor histidine kinase/response regulator)